MTAVVCREDAGWFDFPPQFIAQCNNELLVKFVLTGVIVNLTGTFYGPQYRFRFLSLSDFVLKLIHNFHFMNEI